MGQIDQLRQWVNESDNIVFSVGRGCPQRAESRIFGVWTVSITSSMIIRRKPYSAIPFTEETRKNFIGFTVIKCSALTRSPMPPI